MEKRRGSPLSQEASLVVIPAVRIKSQVGGHGLVLFIKLLPTHLRRVDLQIKGTLTLLEPIEDHLVVICAFWRPGARVGDARVGGRAGVWVGGGWVGATAGGRCVVQQMVQGVSVPKVLSKALKFHQVGLVEL